MYPNSWLGVVRVCGLHGAAQELAESQMNVTKCRRCACVPLNGDGRHKMTIITSVEGDGSDGREKHLPSESAQDWLQTGLGESISRTESTAKPMLESSKTRAVLKLFPGRRKLKLEKLFDLGYEYSGQRKLLKILKRSSIVAQEL